MSKYAKRVDTNQKEIVKVLRDLGCSVVHMHEAGRGIPDLLVGKDDITYLVEIKRDAKASYTPAQIEFQDNWKGAKVVRINNIDDAIDFVKNMV
jgi:Holliday junction resolvase